MGRTKVSIENEKFVNALKRSEKLLVAKMHQNVLKASHLVARSAKKNAPKSTSELTNSIQVRILGTARAEVYTGLEHSSVAEFGRKRGATRPPVEVIKQWIKDKHIQTSNINSAAFLIARSIGKKGIKPQRFMRNAVKENRATVIALIKKAPKFAIDKAGL